MDIGVQIGTPISLGLKDSLNPYAISVGMMFVMLLARRGRSGRLIAWIGGPFVFVCVAGVFMVMVGTFDRWLAEPFVQRFLWFLSLGVAVLFLGTGFRTFRSWRKGNRLPGSGEITADIPAFLQGDGLAASEGPGMHEKGQKIFGIIVLSVILGGFGSLWCSLWPPDYYVYLACAFIVSGGNAASAGLFFALYSLGYAVFFVLIWIAVLSIRRSVRAVRFFAERISIIKAASSAVFFSVGAGLIYLSVFIKS